ncbi:hypothetical protein BT69DRAFT_1362705, partial [Atractiella rhizophila]
MTCSPQVLTTRDKQIHMVLQPLFLSRKPNQMSSQTPDLILDHEKGKAATATTAQNLMSLWSGRSWREGTGNLGMKSLFAWRWGVVLGRLFLRKRVEALVTESDWDLMAKLGTCRERINVPKMQYRALYKQSEIFDLLNFVNMRQVVGEDRKEWWNKWRTKKRAISDARSEAKIRNSFFLDLLKVQSIPPWMGLMEKVENDPKWARDYTSPTLRDKKFES